MENHLLTVTENENDSRTDKFISTQLPDISRNRIQQLITQDAVKLNGNIITDRSHRLKEGDILEIFIPEAIESEMKPSNIPLNIVYEDEHLLVINKQAGLIVHPGSGNYENTMANALMAHCGDSLSGIGGVMRPGIVHRLDKDTTGLLVAAKNDIAHRKLSKQLKDRSLKRIYNTVIWGMPTKPAGKISVNIGRSARDRKKMAPLKSGGRTAVTHYKIKKIFQDKIASLVECRLETGRTHQIRVHLNHIKHPVVGDKTYGSGHGRSLSTLGDGAKSYIRNFHRQALHSKYIGFIHPDSGEFMEFESELPDDMQKLISCFQGVDVL